MTTLGTWSLILPKHRGKQRRTGTWASLHPRDGETSQTFPLATGGGMVDPEVYRCTIKWAKEALVVRDSSEPGQRCWHLEAGPESGETVHAEERRGGHLQCLPWPSTRICFTTGYLGWPFCSIRDVGCSLRHMLLTLTSSGHRELVNLFPNSTVFSQF